MKGLIPWNISQNAFLGCYTIFKNWNYVKEIVDMCKIRYCESCGMLLGSNEVLGSNSDNSKNEEYCIYCYKDGTFASNCTMDEMIEVSVKHMKESGMLKEQNKTEEEAREFMYSFFPKLKRWECTCTEECASGYNPNCTCTSSECHCTEKPD